jgi:hypothetical protein
VWVPGLPAGEQVAPRVALEVLRLDLNAKPVRDFLDHLPGIRVGCSNTKPLHLKSANIVISKRNIYSTNDRN